MPDGTIPETFDLSVILCDSPRNPEADGGLGSHALRGRESRAFPFFGRVLSIPPYFERNDAMKMRTLLLAFCFALAAFSVQAEELRLPSLIGDGMVLQQQSTVPLWGWALAGEKVTVLGSWTEKAVSAKADSQGRWRVDLKTPPAGGPFTIRIQCGPATRLLENILSGEVWICSVSRTWNGICRVSRTPKGILPWQRIPIYGFSPFPRIARRSR